MIPVQKLASLFIRTFSKPISNQIKRYALNQHRQRKRSIIKNLFVAFGNKYHNLETFLNRKQFGVSNKEMFFKPLSDEAALIKGSECFADIFVYSCVIGIPLLELYKSQNDAEKKKKQQDMKLAEINNQIDDLNSIHQSFENEYLRITQENQYIQQQIKTAKSDIEDQINHLVKQHQL